MHKILWINLMDTTTKPTLFSHDAEFQKNHYRSHYQTKNWLQKTFNQDSICIELAEYYSELRNEVVALFLQKKIIKSPIRLEELHLHLNAKQKTYGNDGLSKICLQLYDENQNLKKKLQQFIYHILYKKIFQQSFLFQATPTFRIHCPSALNSAFFPHYHTDLAVGHPPYEINLWIPLTEPYDGHGFYMASLADSTQIADSIDYELPKLMQESLFRDKNYLAFCQPKLTPVHVQQGQALIFDGRCFHTAMPIQTHTRISIDFRIVLENDFTNANLIYENKGLRKQMLLVPNDYYHPQTAAELIV